ncbi:uncharacterized protein LOC126659663 isoform X2 [Mercurialis annua]|uniref:uncharacterized protein LOC126659663 isoform X2 n=1 Tax=Mercurialis annua TaxID=3986 RepID=UPI00216068C7|nr:uncharacterized protein LOC126659663 isoform X2 [Mercurialis annua]
MAESKDTPKTITNNNNPNEPTNLLSLLPKFNLKFPFFNHSEPQPQAQLVVKEDQQTGISEREAENKPNFVRLPNANNPKFTAPFGIEVEEGSGRTHKPIVIWQLLFFKFFRFMHWVDSLF